MIKKIFKFIFGSAFLKELINKLIKLFVAWLLDKIDIKEKKDLQFKSDLREYLNKIDIDDFIAAHKGEIDNLI